VKKDKNLIALYPMDERGGKKIHNVVNNRYNLLIPNKFKVLKKNTLHLPCNVLKSSRANLRDTIVNLIGFIPFGYLLLVYLNSIQPLKKSSWQLIILTIICGIATSLIVEILQGYLPTRNSSITDLILNSSGTGIGIIIAVYLNAKTRSRGKPLSGLH
jgi:glycopeptide antibiotics resistance protein